ncbi:hypothetical protein Verru16b_03394 [Lacunisphaera limnophila]|uniref:DUF1573 domain-containing protein n=1 Tax=Lacunisphaera limnophila TaxID=1838286 RepID=A0A1D8AZH6_9BACT|nr:DUF1573 domain-containing protein [Lacunisphaera limnophila]AOS46293.1 hypothetical protein Verru16b_03394 [Lacunisphaera limnophila]
MNRRLLAPLFLLLAAVTAPALEWPATHLTLRSVPLQKTADTGFDFKNTSDRPVTITSVDVSCDCTEVTPSAKVIAPGATGRLHVRFTLGDRLGVYRRSIIVSTDEGTPPVALTVELDVPEVATLTPRSLEWPLHSAATEQTVDITVIPGIELTISHVQATSDAYTHRLETVTAGRAYRLHLTPRSTAEVANAAFRLHATAGTGEELIFSAYANVR